MAYKGPAYGLSRQCQAKTLSKFDLQRAKDACFWMELMIGEKLDPPSDQFKDHFDVKAALKDGQALCRLMNEIRPGSIPKINNSTVAFKEMENIERFLRACKDYGMKELDTFQTQDLYDNKSMYSVINCLYSLGSLAQRNGFEGPTIGVKLAAENRRSFSEETLQAGRTIINLQYGSNTGASQKGMRPYGATRKM